MRFLLRRWVGYCSYRNMFCGLLQRNCTLFIWDWEWDWSLNATWNDISVIYVMAPRCAGGLKKKFDIRSGSKRHRQCPSKHQHGAILFIRLFRETAPSSRLLRYAGDTILMQHLTVKLQEIQKCSDGSIIKKFLNSILFSNGLSMFLNSEYEYQNIVNTRHESISCQTCDIFFYDDMLLWCLWYIYAILTNDGNPRRERFHYTIPVSSMWNIH